LPRSLLPRVLISPSLKFPELKVKIPALAKNRETRMGKPAKLSPEGANMDSPTLLRLRSGQAQCREAFETIGSPEGTAQIVMPFVCRP